MQAEDQLQALADIRQLMQRSSRFLSLSGLGGVSAGLCALLGAAAVPWYLGIRVWDIWTMHTQIAEMRQAEHASLMLFFVIDSACILLSALLFGTFFTWRKGRKKGYKLWGPTSWQFAYNLAVPLVVGGIFCLLLLLHGSIGLIAPSMLIFYGLTLFHASKWTLDEIRYLGLSEVALGLLSAYYIGYGLVFWTIGFGFLHIIYGTIMWWRYERN